TPSVRERMCDRDVTSVCEHSTSMVSYSLHIDQSYAFGAPCHDLGCLSSGRMVPELLLQLLGPALCTLTVLMNPSFIISCGDDIELLIFLPPPTKDWEYRHVCPPPSSIQTDEIVTALTENMTQQGIDKGFPRTGKLMFPALPSAHATVLHNYSLKKQILGISSYSNCIFDLSLSPNGVDIQARQFSQVGVLADVVSPGGLSASVLTGKLSPSLISFIDTKVSVSAQHQSTIQLLLVKQF
ncbi:hypothetical protein STEG23_009025, partial [Scotinomys teguina]